MKLKNLFAAAAVTAGLCLTGMSAVQAAPKMPESISITYVKSPFNLQNIVMKERGMHRRCLQGRRCQDQLARH